MLAVLKRVTRLFSWRCGVILALVVISAAMLRFPATQRGFFYWDEAQFLFAIQPGVLEIRETLGLQFGPRLFTEIQPFNEEKVPYYAFSTKPGYDLIVLLYGTLFGLTPQSVGALSMLFGLSTLLVLHQITRRVFDDRVALVVVGLLSVSTYHTFYSGSQSSVAMTTFFLLLGVYFYLNVLDYPSTPRLALTGVTLAYAYGCHYNILPYIMTIFCAQAIRLVYVPKAGGLKSLVILGLSFLSVIGAFELFYRLLIPFAYGHLSEGRGAYLSQLRYTMGFFRWVIPSGFERFSTLLLDSEGLAVLAFALFGWTLSARLCLHNWSLAILWALPAIHFLLATYAGFSRSAVFSRMIVTILPFIALWGGVGLARLAEILESQFRMRYKYVYHVAIAVVIAAVIMVQLPRAWAVANLRSGHEESARYVLRYGGGQQVTLGLPVDQYYLGSFSGTYSLPMSVQALRTLKANTGVRLLVLDYRVNVLEEWGHPLGPALREFEATHKPVAVVPNPQAATLLIAAENAMSRQALARTLNDPKSGEIRIYEIDEFLGAGQS